MLITDPLALASACASFRKAGLVSFDTEFVFERTYRPALGLVQLATPASDALPGGLAVAVDPVALKDLRPMWDLLLDDSVRKVVHAGSMDWTIVFQHAGRLPRNVFDSQIAGSFLGYGAQVGYANLVESVLGERVDKVETQTDWLRRPLTDRQLEYAIADVTHLLEVYKRLSRDLETRGRASWVAEECARSLDETRYRDPDPRETFRAIRRASSLRRPELAALRELGAWREREARSRDLRPHILLRDEVIIAIARRMPQGEADLLQVRGLQSSELKRSGAAMLAAVRTARELPESEWPIIDREGALDPQLDVSVSLLLAFVQMRAREVEVSSEVLASRGALKAILRSGPDAVDETGAPVLTSWRKDLLGAELQALCDGRAALAVDAETKRPRLVSLSV